MAAAKENYGQECPRSVWGVLRGKAFFDSTRLNDATRLPEMREFDAKESPRKQVPPSLFFDPCAEIHTHHNRLPHWQQGDVFYFVTWRLADALPHEKLDQWHNEKEAWLKWHPQPWDATTEKEYHRIFSRQIDEWLDAGSGSCLLRDVRSANTVAGALRHFDGERYALAAFVIMPNHVHVLFRLMSPHRLERVMKAWKGFTARKINEQLHRSGTVWQEDYWDRMVRHDKHFAKCRDYILRNPEQAKLRLGEFVLYDALTGDGGATERGHSCP